MTFDDTMQQLESAGTEQNRKVYGRHGVKRDMFGVSYAHLGKLKKQIKQDHKLALELWQSQNHDAMVLATMIADPSTVTKETLQDWSADLDSYVIADALASFIGKTPHTKDLLELWLRSDHEFIGQTGWSLLAGLAMKPNDLPDRYFEAHLQTIEQNIHTQKNRVKHAMNQSLIGIGIRNEVLEAKAKRIATSLGKIDVSHGETACKTPNALAYIDKTLARKGHVLSVA